MIGYCCNCLDGQLNCQTSAHWLSSVTTMYWLSDQQLCCSTTYLFAVDCCWCCVECLCMFTLASKHHCEVVNEMGETFGVWGSQTLFPGHNSKVGISEIVCLLMFEGLFIFPLELRFMSYNFLTSIDRSSTKAFFINLGFCNWLWISPIRELTISDNWKARHQMVYQSLKGLFTFWGQAQVIFHLKLHMLRGVFLNQLNCFMLGKSAF